MKLIFFLCLGTALVLADDSDIQAFASGNNLFTSTLYNELLVENKGNLLASPFSVETLLALTQSGADGDTGKEIRSALHLPSTKEETDDLFKTVLPTFHDKQYKLHTANKVYVANTFPIKDEFKTIAKDDFEASFENINFAASATAADEINEWVEDETEGKIKNFISPGSLDPSTKAFLVNALYFMGNWSHPFDASETRQFNFFKSELETTTSSFMYQRSTLLNYAESEELDAQILELPFRGGDSSMVIVLPKKTEGISILEKMNAPVLVAPKFEQRHVQVTLPKFKIESSLQLNSALETLGIIKAFNPMTADFSGIAGSAGDFSLGQVFQKTFIDVNEGGVEAAAATGIAIPTDVIPPANVIFTADHPFTFYIKVNDIVLFEGRVLVPEYSD